MRNNNEVDNNVAESLDKIAYSPTEFAALFGRSGTWGYRRIYCGDVTARSIAGRAMITKEEVLRFIREAPSYQVKPSLGN